MAALRANAHGNATPGEPLRMPWGSVETTIRDPASNALTFFTPAP